MVVHCPKCGREIFSDPDYCVMCGWKRESPPPRRDTRPRGDVGAGRRTPAQRQAVGPYPRARDSGKRYGESSYSEEIKEIQGMGATPQISAPTVKVKFF